MVEIEIAWRFKLLIILPPAQRGVHLARTSPNLASPIQSFPYSGGHYKPPAVHGVVEIADDHFDERWTHTQGLSVGVNSKIMSCALTRTGRGTLEAQDQRTASSVQSPRIKYASASISAETADQSALPERVAATISSVSTPAAFAMISM